VIFVYDISNKQTFTKLEIWLEEVDAHSPDAVKMVIGNKIDRVGPIQLVHFFYFCHIVSDIFTMYRV
jgi:GTPase SAR1 family protein